MGCLETVQVTQALQADTFTQLDSYLVGNTAGPDEFEGYPSAPAESMLPHNSSIVWIPRV